MLAPIGAYLKRFRSKHTAAEIKQRRDVKGFKWDHVDPTNHLKELL
jgi:hypothetical protein